MRRDGEGFDFRRAVSGYVLAVLVFVMLSSLVAHRVQAVVVPSCDPAAGVIQIVGLELLVTARSGDDNDVRIELIGGTYTPPLTGVPLTTQVYRISDPGASFAYAYETGCASDEAATCSQDPDGVTTCAAILTDLTISLGDGNDSAIATGVPAPALIAGGNGNDTIVGGEAGDRLLGGNDGDLIAGGPGDDTINGANGWDTLEGGPGDDTILGGSNDPLSTSGNDTIRGGPGHDTLDGGSGSLTDPDHDLLDYSDESTSIVVNLTTGEGTDTVNHFEEVLGGSGDDEITGHPSASRVDGGPGNDTIDGQGAEALGGEGDDILYALRSEDETLHGGPGDDRIFDNFRCDCFIGDHNDDTFIGGPGNDRLVAGGGNNTLLGGDGDDWLVTGCEVDFEHSTLRGGAGDDTLSGIPESVLDDECYFGNRHEGTVEHGDAQDLLDGESGVDTLDLCVPADPNSLDVPAGYRPLPDDSHTTCLRTAAQYATSLEAGHVAYRGHTAEQDTLISIANVIGGGGNDLLFGTGGIVNGGPGSDDISCGRALDGGPGGPGDGGDVLRDCPGASYRGAADYSNRAEPVHVSLDGIANDGSWDEATATSEGDNVLATGGIAGGAGNDELTGDAAFNILEGGDGDDLIDAAAGEDFVFGGDGADTIDGGAGGDLLFGDAGPDIILARDGNAELIECGSEADVARLDRLDQPTDCETTIVGLTQPVAGGDVVTTDVEGDGADPQHPIEVTIQAAAAGTIEATERPSSAPNPSGFVLVGIRYDLRLPASTAEAPNVLTFRVDASLIPAGQDENAIFVYRNGVVVPDCDPSPPRVSTTAAPDPCVALRRLLADGDVEIVVLTSIASDWDFAVDVEAPAIAIASPIDGASLLLAASVVADYACTDAGSGLASCVGPVPVGGLVDTAAIGPHTFKVDAADRVGNTASMSVDYQVIYDFRGFFSPLENPGHVDGLLNVAKAGASIPIKFSLRGNQGLGVLASGSPTSVAVSCDTSAPADVVEEISTPGTSGLAYDAASDTYRLVWKTNKTWAGTCREFTLRLIDGTDHRVLFRFTK